jgi:hypothetical protein
MERWSTCETSCSEHKLAADFDRLEADRSAGRARVGAFRRAVEALAGTEPGPDGWRAAWQAMQRAALAVLSRDETRDDSDEPAGHVTTWQVSEARRRRVVGGAHCEALEGQSRAADHSMRLGRAGGPLPHPRRAPPYLCTQASGAESRRLTLAPDDELRASSPTLSSLSQCPTSGRPGIAPARR